MPGPIISFLEDWKPLLPRPKLFGGIMHKQMKLPAGITEDQAIALMQETNWIHGIGEGMADRISDQMRIQTGTALPKNQRDAIANAWSAHVATSVVLGKERTRTREATMVESRRSGGRRGPGRPHRAAAPGMPGGSMEQPSPTARPASETG